MNINPRRGSLFVSPGPTSMRVCFGLLVEVDGCKENLGVVVDFSAPRGTLLGRCLWRFPVNGYYEDIHLVLVQPSSGVQLAFLHSTGG